jgi:PhnB protein
MAQPIPHGFHSLSAHLIVQDAPRALAFYESALGAKTTLRALMPDGKAIMHAELQLGDTRFMVGEENVQWGALSPRSLGGSPVTLHLYVPDVDAVFTRASNAGCKVLMAPENMFWGDRYAKLEDPFGHHWAIATHQEDVGAEEMQRRAAEAFAGPKS